MGQGLMMLCQQLLGCALSVPAALGLGLPPAIAATLLRHGALCQLAWELAGLASSAGTRTQPRGTFGFLRTHFSLQWALVIPMNIYYSDFTGYHEMLLLLQIAATVGALAHFFGQTFDSSKRIDVAWLFEFHGLCLAVIVYTRWVHYWWSLSKCLMHFYEDEAYCFLLSGLVCGGLLIPYVGATQICALYQEWWCPAAVGWLREVQEWDVERSNPCASSPSSPSAQSDVTGTSGVQHLPRLLGAGKKDEDSQHNVKGAKMVGSGKKEEDSQRNVKGAKKVAFREMPKGQSDS
jgi:hypothetical protein